MILRNITLSKKINLTQDMKKIRMSEQENEIVSDKTMKDYDELIEDIKKMPIYEAQNNTTRFN